MPKTHSNIFKTATAKIKNKTHEMMSAFRDDIFLAMSFLFMTGKAKAKIAPSASKAYVLGGFLIAPLRTLRTVFR